MGEREFRLGRQHDAPRSKRQAYTLLADELKRLGIAYVHVVDHSFMGAPKVPEALQASIRERFAGPFIAAGVLTLESAQQAIDEKRADLVDFGRPFLANPDLVARLQNGWPLNAPDFSTFYTPGPTGYIDYPAHAA